MAINTPYNLGRVGLNIRGQYASNINYQKLDVVHYNGSSYVAKTDVSAGILPTNTNSWMMMARGENTIAEVYPVGSIYMSVASASPATLFGGTWERIQDMFLLAAGSAYPAASRGGAAEVALTVEQMPSHSHKLGVNSRKVGSGSTYNKPHNYNSGDNGALGYQCTPVGGGQAHNNMPPYLAVFAWKRTA